MTKQYIVLCTTIVITSTLLSMDAPTEITPLTQEKHQELITQWGGFGEQIKQDDREIQEAQKGIDLLTELNLDNPTPRIPQIPQLSTTATVTIEYNCDPELEKALIAPKTPRANLTDETSMISGQQSSPIPQIIEAPSHPKTPPSSPRSEIPKPITPRMPTKNTQTTTSNEPDKKTWFQKHQPIVIIAGIGMSIAAFVALLYYLKNSTNGLKLF